MRKITPSSLLVFLFTLTKCSHLCPQNCKCAHINNLLVSDCSSLSLKHVPQQLDNNTVTLDLSYNHISVIEDSAFKKSGLLLLNTVYLQNNDLTAIKSEAFQGLSSLNELYLQNNLLTSINTEIFADNHNLRVLNIENNNIKLFPNITLKHLKDLMFKFNDISSFEFTDVLIQFPKIKKLDISWNRISNIDKTNNNTNKNIFLREVDLSNNKIVEISEYIFLLFPKLIKLNLSTNALRLKSSPKYFEQNSRLKILDLSLNRISCLHHEIFKFLYDLEEILLHSNIISFLHADIFKYNSHLIRVILKSNNINILPPDIFNFNLMLQEVDISDNYIKTIHAETFFRNPFLTKIDFSCSSKLSSLCGIDYLDSLTFNKNGRLLEIDISNNKITEINFQTFSGNPSLKILNLQSNEIENLHQHAFQYNPKLQSLNLGNNSLKYLHENIFSQNQNLLQIDLSKNSVTNLSSKIFENNINLQTLNLSFNKLFEKDFLLKSETLKLLDISYCYITELPSDIFSYLPNLQQLLLNGNKLKNIDIALNSVQNLYTGTPTLTNLQRLDLSNNDIENIDIAVLCNKQYLKKINLISNPLICSCSLKTIWEWCKTYKIELSAKSCNSVDMCNNIVGFCGNNTNTSTYLFDFSTKVSKFDILPPQYPEAQHSTLSMFITFGILFLVVVLIMIGWLYPLFYKQNTNRSDEYELQDIKHDTNKNGRDLLLYPQVSYD